MFTGIIEEIGTVEALFLEGNSGQIRIRAKRVLEGTKIGDSIAVDGVCLTVTALQNEDFEADVMAETVRRSSLGEKRPGSRVNLERAMAAEGRFGGHMVSGHIDGTGTLCSIRREENAIWYQVQVEQALLDGIVEKGSIAVDGISLTVAKVEDRSFFISIIPHTSGSTTLQDRSVGDDVNLETDMLGKYVRKFLKPSQNTGLTYEMLEAYGL